jgi:hypothetical protein
MHEARFVAPVEKVRHGRTMRARRHEGFHTLLAMPNMPNGHRPKSPTSVSEQRGCLKSVCHPRLKERSQGEDHEPRKEASRPQPESGDAYEVGHASLLLALQTVEDMAQLLMAGAEQHHHRIT